MGPAVGKNSWSRLPDCLSKPMHRRVGGIPKQKMQYRPTKNMDWSYYGGRTAHLRHAGFRLTKQT